MDRFEVEAQPDDDVVVGDDWSADEWWRAQNPGASFMRGLLWATAFSSVVWLVTGIVVWAVFFSN